MAETAETSIRLPLACGIVVLWVLYRLYDSIRLNTKYRFPAPVPGRVPFLGNLLQVPKHPAEQRLYFADLAKQHGEMCTLKLGSNNWVLLNSPRVVNELMEKRGGLYNSRANLPMAGEILSGGKRIVFMPYGDLWKWERKVVHEILGPAKKEMFAPYQDTESRALLYEYLTQPDKWHLSNARYSSSVIMSVVFGRRTKLNDENVARIVQANDELTKVFEPGSNLIDAFPFLGRIPLPKSIQPWRWWGDAQYEQTLKNFRQEFEGLEQRQRQGKAQDCFVSEFLKLERDKRIDWDTMIFLAGSVIEAGSDTTRVSLSQILAAAALFPDWVERARKQIDEVCGANAERLPVAGDAPRMPLIKAAAKEAVRWNPSFGDIAHSLTQDDEFEGYRFPAGTIFSWNHWGIHNDPKVYDQPERFWPERFLNEDLDKPTKGHFGFGAGRRVCPGHHVAATSLFLGISRLIYCFDFHTVPGHPIPVGKPFSIGVEKPYEVKVTSRSPAHEALIRRECASAALGD